MRTYDLYGARMASDYPFVNPLPTAREDQDIAIVFSCGSSPPAGTTWSDATVVATQGEWPDGSTDFTFARFADHDAVRIGEAVDFHVYDDRIVCHLRDERHRYLVEIALLGMVYALWLERRGTPTLHASVATLGGRAAGFLGNKGGGKTSALAACLARGHALLTDDLLAVTRTAEDFQVERGFSSLRLWPEQADHFLGGVDGLPLVRPDTAKVRTTVGVENSFGRFAVGAAPLRRLYLPERHDDAGLDDVRLEPLPPEQAIMSLLRHSFLPREVHLFGWQPTRLKVLADLVGHVPVVRLRYRSGLERLPAVIARLEEDLDADEPHG